MKKLLLSLLLAGCLPLSAYAGAMPPPPNDPPGHVGEGEFRKHHEQKIDMMAKELGLTDDQRTKVNAVFDEQRAKFKAIHEETKTRLQAILTPEQLQKFDAMHPMRPLSPPRAQ